MKKLFKIVLNKFFCNVDLHASCRREKFGNFNHMAGGEKATEL